MWVVPSEQRPIAAKDDDVVVCTAGVTRDIYDYIRSKSLAVVRARDVVLDAEGNFPSMC